jgi:ParB family chromosome partitioning protein
MARKGILADITATDSALAVKTPPSTFHSRGAFGAVTRTIDDLAARADAARDIEAKLTAGQTVVELDPLLVDSSFVTDRLSQDDDDYRALLDAIRERGQDSPILVRPHPVEAGRYQVAFGHRRLKAARDLGRAVRAVVKTLDDRALILAQGQENSARANLSFIERALFARRLEDAAYDRETIMSALSVDKTTISRMISVAVAIPIGVIEAIGPAPSAGRDRWSELAAAFRDSADPASINSILSSEAFSDATSDGRFVLALSHFVSTPAQGVSARRVRPSYWSTSEGTRVAKISSSDKAVLVSIDKRAAPGFGDFLISQLDSLYAAYENQQKES